jgi:hypothetical protein
MFVIENTNADPFSGTFTWKGQITDATNKWAIDGTVLQHPSGQLYFIWSGWEGDVDERQIIYIAQMSNPWTVSSARVEIARPIYSWETNHRPYINEGPEVTVRNDIIVLVYSASGSWTDDYCLGLITASTSSSPNLQMVEKIGLYIIQLVIVVRVGFDKFVLNSSHGMLIQHQIWASQPIGIYQYAYHLVIKVEIVMKLSLHVF